MQKLTTIFIILAVTTGTCLAQTTAIQQDSAPPLLLQQGTAMAPQSPPIGPATAPPYNVPPPSPGPGIPVVQTISTQTLLSKLPQAVNSAQAARKLLMPGKVWIMRAPAGEVEIKAGLLYQGVAVAVLHFNAQDGSVLPLGINPHNSQDIVSVETVKRSLSAIVQDLKILPVAEFLEPETSWSFPIVYNNIIVAHLKVYYDGIHIMQDFPANQEMSFYGQ